MARWQWTQPLAMSLFTGLGTLAEARESLPHTSHLEHTGVFRPWNCRVSHKLWFLLDSECIWNLFVLFIDHKLFKNFYFSWDVLLWCFYVVIADLISEYYQNWIKTKLEQSVTWIVYVKLLEDRECI